MPIATWPANLPQQALRDAYDFETPDDVVQKREVEDGAPIRRRKRLNIWTPVTLAMVMTRAQWVSLLSFWRVTLNAGQEPFQMPVWDFSGVTVTKTVYLDAPPKPATLGADRVRVSMQLRVRDLY